VARRLGTVRTPLFHPRGPGALASQIALLWPPAVILTGDVREESPELRYVLGGALTGAMPEHVLVNAWPEESVRTLIEALLAAFGPVDARRDSPTDAVAKLERDLWQLVPPRGARRLSELLADSKDVTYAAARDATRRAMRRAGLFASGSVSTAISRAVVDLRLPLPVPLTDPTGLHRACERHAEIADLVRLAIRTEYAEARWHAATTTELRRTESGSRFRNPTQ